MKSRTPVGVDEPLDYVFICTGRSAITTSTGVSDQQRHIDQCDALENYNQQQHLYRPEPEQPESIAPPQFVSPIKDQKNIHENGFAHFDARLEPSNDSTMKVEWFKDGRPVDASKFNEYATVQYI